MSDGRNAVRLFEKGESAWETVETIIWLPVTIILAIVAFISFVGASLNPDDPEWGRRHVEPAFWLCLLGIAVFLLATRIRGSVAVRLILLLPAIGLVGGAAWSLYQGRYSLNPDGTLRAALAEARNEALADGDAAQSRSFNKLLRHGRCIPVRNNRDTIEWCNTYGIAELEGTCMGDDGGSFYCCNVAGWPVQEPNRRLLEGGVQQPWQYTCRPSKAQTKHSAAPIIGRQECLARIDALKLEYQTGYKWLEVLPATSLATICPREVEDTLSRAPSRKPFCAKVIEDIPTMQQLFGADWYGALSKEQRTACDADIRRYLEGRR